MNAPNAGVETPFTEQPDGAAPGPRPPWNENRPRRRGCAPASLAGERGGAARGRGGAPSYACVRGCAERCSLARGSRETAKDRHVQGVLPGNRAVVPEWFVREWQRCPRACRDAGFGGVLLQGTGGGRLPLFWKVIVLASRQRPVRAPTGFPGEKQVQGDAKTVRWF